LPTEEDNSFEHLFDNTNEPPIQPKRRSGLLNAPEDIEEEDPDAHYFEDYEDKEEFIEEEEIESDDSDERMEEELDMQCEKLIAEIENPEKGQNRNAKPVGKAI
jgi:hypothetical protein